MVSELGFAKEYFSGISLISFPVNIISSVLFGYLGKDNPFKIFYWANFFLNFAYLYVILVILGLYPAIGEADSWWNIGHITIMCQILTMLSTVQFSASFGVYMKCHDSRISSLHITLLASLSNLTSLVHKSWVFWVVEKFGLFYP
jgi:uncharacterized membrane protein